MAAQVMGVTSIGEVLAMHAHNGEAGIAALESLEARVLLAGNDLLFIHHSVGQNWLDNSLREALQAKSYLDGVNEITYADHVAPDTGRQDSLAAPGTAQGDFTDMEHWLLWFNDYIGSIGTWRTDGGVNRIVMFKSCFPNSDITDDGVAPGDPFSGDNTLANYEAVYHNAAGGGAAYTFDGRSYRALEDVFAAHPDTLFIPVTAPPLCYGDPTASTDADARRARLFNDWLKGDWLTSYNAAHPALHNVAVFDLFDVLANRDSGVHPNRLQGAFGGGGTDSHPNAAGNELLTQRFATNTDDFIDTAWGAFFAGPQVDVSFEGTRIISGQADAIDFGRVMAGGTNPARTFLVRNTGSLPLTLGAPVLPAGFVLDEGLETTLAAGAQDTFTVHMDAASGIGAKNGEVSFTTGDPGMPTFHFAVGGTVADPDQFVSFAASDPFPSFLDTAGHTVTVRLTGPGTGQLYLTGDGAGDIRRLVLDDTTARSTLKITVARNARTPVGDIQVDGPILSIAAAGADVTGAVNVTGTISTLTLGNVTGGTLTITGPAVPVTAKFDQVTDMTITSACPIRSLTVTRWADTGAEADVDVTAPWIGSLTASGKAAGPRGVPAAIPGDFQADLALTPRAVEDARVRTTLTTARIAGNLTADTWSIVGNVGTLAVAGWAMPRTADGRLVLRATGNVAAVTVGGAQHLDLLAGVRAAGTGEDLRYTDAYADFANPAATLTSLTVQRVKGLPATTRFVQDSNVTAGRIGRMSLWNLDPAAPSGVHFLPAGTSTVKPSVTYADSADPLNRGSWRWGQVPVPALVHYYRIFGVGFGPYVGSQRPPQTVTRAQIQQRLGIVAPTTQWVRSFGAGTGLQAIPAVAKGMGLKVAMGTWINDYATDPSADPEMAALITAARAGQVDIAVVGNEDIQQGRATAEQVVTYLTYFKAQVPGVPVTMADRYETSFARNPDGTLTYQNVLNACDVILVNYYPFWAGLAVDDAMAAVDTWHQDVVAHSGGKAIYVAETGWPTAGPDNAAAVPSPQNAASYFQQFTSWAQTKNVPVFWFEATDEAWKTEGGVGPHWGVWDARGALKPGMAPTILGQTAADTWTGTAAIQFTQVPAMGSDADLQGTILHASPLATKVAVYILVAGQWWTKPNFASPLTDIGYLVPNYGTWTCDITTGGLDAQATSIAAFLLPAGATAPLADGLAALPPELAILALASLTVTR
jgi:glucan 1,3-beta-glucosidase